MKRSFILLFFSAFMLAQLSGQKSSLIILGDMHYDLLEDHDITGPGAKEAFQEFYVPMIQKQSGNPEIINASYSYSYDNVQITCLDPWDREIDMVAFLDSELSASDAKYKFVAIHEPVIPVTERCWHVLRKDQEEREKLLRVIASHKAIVLCGHLHRYSVVRRSTPYGPIVQVMALSVVKDRSYQIPSKVITEYGLPWRRIFPNGKQKQWMRASPCWRKRQSMWTILNNVICPESL